MFELYYGIYRDALWADISVDFFINGYQIDKYACTNTSVHFIRDNRGGFFYEVFK